MRRALIPALVLALLGVAFWQSAAVRVDEAERESPVLAADPATGAILLDLDDDVDSADRSRIGALLQRAIAPFDWSPNDLGETLSESAELQVALNLEPGDAYIANNYTVLHSRTSFEDYDTADKRRYLLRLWLKAVHGRPVVDAVRRFYRDDGITGREGASTVYVHAGAEQN